MLGSFGIDVTIASVERIANEINDEGLKAYACKTC